MFCQTKCEDKSDRPEPRVVSEDLVHEFYWPWEQIYGLDLVFHPQITPRPEKQRSSSEPASAKDAIDSGH
jgi:hypothetical protein